MAYTFFSRSKAQAERLNNWQNPQQQKYTRYDDLVKKAYLLQFLKNGNAVQTFSLSVPPESEDFTYTYRLNETKTFGGSCIDSYGNDLYKISLNGSTINQDVKSVYTGQTGAKESLTGEEEVFKLQNLLEKYVNETQGANTELVLYDLSKNKSSNDNKNYVPGCYTVYPTDFKIRRSKDMPMTFNYTIEFMAKPRKGKFQVVSDSETDTTISSTQDPWYQKYADFLDLVKFAFTEAGVGMINAAAGDIGDLAKEVLKELEGPADIAAYMIDSSKYIGAVVRDVQSRAKLTAYKYSFGNGGEAPSTELPQTGTEKAIDTLKKAANKTNECIEKIRELEANLDSVTSEMRALSMRINKPIEQILKESELSYMDILSLIYGTMLSVIKDPVELIFVTDENEDMTVIKTYGYNIIVWKQGDTLNHISYNLYGTEKYASMILQYNGFIAEEDIPLGKKLRCPKLKPTNNAETSNVYSMTEKIYGTDIDVDEDGNLLIQKGDLKPIGGQENLNKSIVTRLTNHVNTNLKSLTVGIIDAIGDTDTVSTFIVESAKQTLEDEPRIQEIQRLEFRGQGNRLEITVAYTDISQQEMAITTVI